MATVTDAGLVVYLEGFQPAVDEAVAQEAGQRPRRRRRDLLPRGAATQEIEEARRRWSGTATDPHVWLDPTNLAHIADTVASSASPPSTRRARPTFPANANAGSTPS